MRITKEVDCQNEPIAENDVTSVEKRFYYWYPEERIQDLGFWIETDHRVSYSELAPIHLSVSDTVGKIRDRGYHLFVADMTLPEMRAQGFEALKVVIPELHALYLDERAKSLYSVHHGQIHDDGLLKPHPFT